MKRRRLKDDGKRVTDAGRIPNAEQVARGLMEPEVAIYHAVERGRTIGRLEGIADAFEKANVDWLNVTNESAKFIAPILRAEIERLRAS